MRNIKHITAMAYILRENWINQAMNNLLQRTQKAVPLKSTLRDAMNITCGIIGWESYKNELPRSRAARYQYEFLFY